MGNLAARNKCAQSNLSPPLSVLRVSSRSEDCSGFWFINHLIFHMLLPTTREGNVFTGVCHSVRNRPYGYLVTAHPCYCAVGTHHTGFLFLFTDLKLIIHLGTRVKRNQNLRKLLIIYRNRRYRTCISYRTIAEMQTNSECILVAFYCYIRILASLWMRKLF